MTAVYLLASMAIVLGSSLFQSIRLVGVGTDHPVHVFLATVIRESGHRLLTRIPRLLNEAYCSAYPIFLHWILSFLSRSAMATAAIVLNPSMNALTLLATWVFAVGERPQAPTLAGIAVLLLALTPQYYHLASARNFGLSSRPIGMFLLTVFLALGERLASGSATWPVIVAAVLTSYLIWGFNTFAQQALLIFAAIIAVRLNAWSILAAAGGGLVLFILLHFRYAKAYLVHTVGHLRAYSRDLAPIFILTYRYSIWRDLVWDIWKALRRSFGKGVMYGYSNPALIVLFLNPLTVGAAILAFTLPASAEPLPRYCAEVSLAAVIMGVATSFRLTRFLGEPERYVELATPFGTIAAVWFLLGRGQVSAMVAVAVYFALIDVAQFALTVRTKSNSAPALEEVEQIAAAVREHFPADEEVRFTSNNDQLAKLFMENRWAFLRLWSADTKYGTVPFPEAVTVFPLIRREAFEAMALWCRTNVLLLDRSHFDTVFDDRPDIASRLQCLYENARYRVYRLRWSEA